MNSLGKQALGRAHAGLGGGCIAFAIDGNEFAEFEGQTEQGELEDLALGESSGASGDARNQARGVEVGDMVGHEDASLAFRDVLESFNTNADAGRAKGHADDEADHVVERSGVAGDGGQREEDDRRRNAESDDDGDDEERNDHGRSTREQDISLKKGARLTSSFASVRAVRRRWRRGRPA